MRRAHSFKRHYWSRELSGVKIVYRCECGASRALILFGDAERLLTQIKDVEEAL